MNAAETEVELDKYFSYHAPKGSQPQRYEEIRAGAKQLARIIMSACPDCADKSAALRKVREAVMTANAAIACNE